MIISPFAKNKNKKLKNISLLPYYNHQFNILCFVDLFCDYELSAKCIVFLFPANGLVNMQCNFIIISSRVSSFVVVVFFLCSFFFFISNHCHSAHVHAGTAIQLVCRYCANDVRPMRICCFTVFVLL